MRTESFQPVVAAARQARMFAVGHPGISSPTSERVALLVAELAANAVVHAHTPFSVTTRDDGEVLRVEVHDECSAMPQLSEAPPPDAVSGRGLFLVDQLANRWGVERCTGDGKTVWFEVDGNGRCGASPADG